MRSRYSNILTLLVALLAFVPVFAVDYLFDGFVRERETAQLQAAVDALTHDSQTTVHDAIDSLGRVLSQSPSLCTSTFFDNVNTEIQRSLYLKQVIVENGSGVQYCAAFDTNVTYRVLSEKLTIPGHTATMTAVRLEGQDTPMLKVSQSVGENRTVSAFVVAAPLAARNSLPALGEASYLEVALTNGTPIVQVGERLPGQDDALVVRSFAGEIPLRAEIASPFSVARSKYGTLDIGFTMAACLVSVGILLAALQYVRRSQLPAFALERAIAAGELRPYYQPVVNLRTGRISGCEVLIRWVKPNGKVVPPGAFIDYAEMTGLAIPMTLNLMEQVRHDLEAICRETPDFKVGINLFEGHFRDGSVVEDIQSIFAGSGISYRQLVFEITERQPLDDRESAKRTISSMHALGVRVAMDDAGTGHSNLAYLHTLGMDIIKIDKIFVDMITDADAPVPVIDGLIAMAHDMDIDIIAEGVETPEQALYLRSKGVIFAQGYLFAPALKLNAFLTLARGLPPEGRARSHLDPRLAA